LSDLRAPLQSGAVPRIDVSAARRAGHDAPAARDVQARLHSACAEIGFLTVTGHGVPRALIDAVGSAASGFFERSPADKLAVAPRRWNRASPNAYRGYFPASVAGKEGLDVGDPRLGASAESSCAYQEPNPVLDHLDRAARRAVIDYFDAVGALAADLLRWLVAALGGRPERVDAGFARPQALSTLRFNFYPEREEPVAIAKDDGAPLACEAHVDSGLLTLLHQDDRGGLEVCGTDGRWHAIEPDADAFVVNTGLALQRMTDRALVATRHRVRFTRRPRLSIPFFFEPVPGFAMTPRSLDLPFPAPGEPQTYEQYLTDSLARFAEYQR